MLDPDDHYGYIRINNNLFLNRTDYSVTHRFDDQLHLIGTLSYSTIIPTTMIKEGQETARHVVYSNHLSDLKLEDKPYQLFLDETSMGVVCSVNEMNHLLEPVQAYPVTTETEEYVSIDFEHRPPVIAHFLIEEYADRQYLFLFTS